MDFKHISITSVLLHLGKRCERIHERNSLFQTNRNVKPIFLIDVKLKRNNLVPLQNF